MSTYLLAWTRKYLGRAGALLVVLAVLASLASPIFSECHEDEVAHKDHNDCAAVHVCCTTHVTALATTSTATPILLSLNSSLLTGDMPSTGILISDAPFHPPRT